MIMKNISTPQSAMGWHYNLTKAISNQPPTINQFNYDKTLFQSNLAPFGETTYEFVNNWNQYSFIQNIISFIVANSQNKYNYAEMEYHFPFADQRKSYAQDNTDNILNISNCENLNTYFILPPVENSYLGIKFTHIELRPTSYSIGFLASPNKSNLISFVFEGFDEKDKKWDIIDAQENIDEKFPGEGIYTFKFNTAEQKYSIFILRQTSPGNNGKWGFSLSYFDIDGYVMIKNNLNEEIPLISDDDDRDGIESLYRQFS